MTYELRVPALPESIADATVLKWHQAPGAGLTANEPLVDLETDKVILEVPSPIDGTLETIIAPPETVVQANAVLAVLNPNKTVNLAPRNPALTDAQIDTAVELRPAVLPNEIDPPPRPVAIAPAARQLINALQLDASQIPGSGKDGRIHKADVMAWLDRIEHAAPAIDPDHLSAAVTANTASFDHQTDANDPAPANNEQRVPMTRLRARIAERLVHAQQQAALLTTFNEVDMSAVSALRQQYRELFEKRHQVRLGFMSFFIKAAVAALQRFPIINAAIDGTDVVYYQTYDIGIAVSTERGLVVPIVRQCDQLTMAEIERQIAAFGAKARDGSLTVEELTGGTFSITNGGVFGSLLSTPIINPPQSAILGLHKIQERPIALNGQVVIRPMMYLALTYDHRLIDGRDAVRFLVCIKELIEDPTRLLLQL
ncbi:2-oxoglutarate dehydrogenase complex dihydrolipoyllysine-residue succinyltransferase [Thiospirillum jenense]|uniref:Dihydrolipoyllysine-residue succinyltransferase component of 2-oxoglutarate dehydrogenase complex n=1 Tax=Thiospirillum jenense TaxID=1653858 RepID=A0A839H8G2_9GAMM|nr:2-oxoglutarate dehydrogenase complex dihydrolipoyllysine-residue succinyltransferase [Thiospirillum jenense]MBB1125304.1 2-oxoglutarate dehydrogenase complex dihydrolipoyllysine-residue succinyltransferase [Thiospirillum jenense]